MARDDDPLKVTSYLRRAVPVPVTLINTRDCFAYDLLCDEEVLNLGPGREKVIKKRWYFDPNVQYPANLKEVLGLPKDADMTKKENLYAGATSYENFFTHQEMDEMEKLIENTEEICLRDGYFPMTAQKTY